jgi:hypothetical protein
MVYIGIASSEQLNVLTRDGNDAYRE